MCFGFDSGPQLEPRTCLPRDKIAMILVFLIVLRFALRSLAAFWISALCAILLLVSCLIAGLVNQLHLSAVIVTV